MQAGAIAAVTINRPYLESVANVLRTEPEVERLDPGLTELELVEIEAHYGVVFPPDLKAMLQYVLPIERRFPNWRSASLFEIQIALDGPMEGTCFDVEQNGFWVSTWGPRPVSVEDRRIRFWSDALDW